MQLQMNINKPAIKNTKIQNIIAIITTFIRKYRESFLLLKFQLCVYFRFKEPEQQVLVDRSYVFLVYIFIFLFLIRFLDFWNLDIPSFFAKQLCVLALWYVYSIILIWFIWHKSSSYSVFHTDAYDKNPMHSIFFSS